MEQLFFDVRFKDFEFSKSFTEFIVKQLKVSKIECFVNSEWIHIRELSEIDDFEYEQIRFKLNQGGNRIVLQNISNTLPRFFCSDISLKLNDILSEKMLEYSSKIVCGSIQDSLENILQNSDDVNSWKLYEKNLPQYAQVFLNPLYQAGKPGMDMIVKEYVSVESLPGHSHIMNYEDMLWFGSCWQMYFSPFYYKYIPKPLFDNFNYCFENVILNNDLRRITLYENANSYNNPENRDKQWAFRRQLGIDSIAHELTNSINRIEPQNLPVQITKKNCLKGQTKVTRFLNNEGQLVSSNIASKVEVKEYLEDGISVVYEDLKVL